LSAFGGAGASLGQRVDSVPVRCTVAPDGSQVVSIADQDGSDRDKLYALVAPPLLLNGIGRLDHPLLLPIARSR
jgi:hypothetical protein